MLADSNHFKIIYICALQILLLVPCLCLILDSNNCERSTQLLFPIVSEPEIKYYLFTSGENILEGEEIHDQNITSLETSEFEKKWRTRIFISGWKSTAQHCKTALIRDAYLKLGNFNFILVDWSDWNTREYSSAAASVNNVGKLLGNFTKFLNSNGISCDDIYLIGLGLGAHVAGAAGESILPNKFNTIYGLDPAGNDFIDTPSSNRLDPSDAKYVEIIVTDMYYNGFGAEGPLGHAQFYPYNGRRIQPSCSRDLIDEFIPGEQFCSHTASVEYFVNTLNSEIQFCGVSTTWSDIFSMYIPQNNETCEIVMGGEPSIPKIGFYYIFASASGFLPA